MWRSRAITVTTESKILRLQIDADARLAAAAGGVARFLAVSGGLSDEAAVELQKSVLAACNEAFQNLEGRDHLTVVFSWYADRIEVALESRAGAAPALGLDHIAGLATQFGEAAALNGVDRVQYDTCDGVSVTRLTKYLRPAPRTA
jgi:hypothetical protein